MNLLYKLDMLFNHFLETYTNWSNFIFLVGNWIQKVTCEKDNAFGTVINIYKKMTTTCVVLRIRYDNVIGLSRKKQR